MEETFFKTFVKENRIWILICTLIFATIAIFIGWCFDMYINRTRKYLSFIEKVSPIPKYYNISPQEIRPKLLDQSVKIYITRYGELETYLVAVSDKVQIYSPQITSRTINSTYDKLIKEYDYENIFVGGDDAVSSLDATSLLIELKNNRYVFVGPEVIEFAAYNKIEKFDAYTNIVNVPPIVYAIDIDGRYYLLNYQTVLTNAKKADVLSYEEGMLHFVHEVNSNLLDGKTGTELKKVIAFRVFGEPMFLEYKPTDHAARFEKLVSTFSNPLNRTSIRSENGVKLVLEGGKTHDLTVDLYVSILEDHANRNGLKPLLGVKTRSSLVSALENFLKNQLVQLTVNRRTERDDFLNAKDLVKFNCDRSGLCEKIRKLLHARSKERWFDANLTKLKSNILKRHQLELDTRRLRSIVANIPTNNECEGFANNLSSKMFNCSREHDIFRAEVVNFIRLIRIRPKLQFERFPKSKYLWSKWFGQETSLNFFDFFIENRERPTEYITSYNWDYQYKMVMKENSVILKKEGKRSGWENYSPLFNQTVVEYNPEFVFVGKCPRTSLNLFRSAAYDGCANLLHLQNQKYAFVCNSIFEFEAPGKIHSFHVIMGLNDVSYPFAIDADARHYVFDNGKVFVFNPKSVPSNFYFSPHHFFYEISDLGEKKLLEYGQYASTDDIDVVK